MSTNPPPAPKENSVNFQYYKKQSVCFCEGRKGDIEHQRGQAKSEKGNRDVLNSEAFD